MARVLRYDLAPVGKAERTAAGWLKAPAHITRVGVFEYRMADGTVRRELRPADEVLTEQSLSSFGMVPVTDSHPDPREAPEGLTAANVRKYQVGHLGETVKADGEKVAATVMITDETAIEKVLAGKSQLSCGYVCDCEEKPGEWNGQRYDAVQRNIVGNHVAIVNVARGGPEIRLRLDHADGAMVAPSQEDDATRRETKPMKYVIDGVEYEVTDQVGQALKKREEKDITTIEAAGKTAATQMQVATAAKTEADKQTARADAADKRIAALESELKAAKDPAAMTSAVEARAKLLSEARPILGKDFKSDGLDDVGLKRAVLVKLDGTEKEKLEKASPDYVSAAFEYAMKARTAQKKTGDVVRVDQETLDEQLAAAESPAARLAKEVSELSERASTPRTDADDEEDQDEDAKK
jgi:hypothetical protein